MKRIFLVQAILAIWFHTHATGFIPYTDPALQGLVCREEISNSYKYIRYHRVSDIANDTEDGFRLDFKVRAASNAHISLSENAFIVNRDAAYEIVLGANWNTYSDIRRGRGTSSKVKTNTKNIVSRSETHGFWIYVHKDGRILVGRENDTLPFLMWKDTIPIRVRFISFCTWRDVTGLWYYSCKKYEEQRNPNEEEVITSRPLTWTEKLHSDLLTDYDPYTAPRPPNTTESKRTAVFAHLGCRHVEMSWFDEKLTWSPKDYGNITSIVLQAWEAWVPDLMLYNSAAPADLDIFYGLREVGMIVSSEGIVFWAPYAHFSAFCENIDLRKWPKDTQTCELRLGFWSQQRLLELNLWENVTYLEENRVETEWQVTDVSADTVWIRTPWANAAVKLGMDVPLVVDGSDLVDPMAYNDYGEPEIVVHSSMAIKVTLVRRNTAYNTVLLIPLAMILICTLLSFWAFPLGPVKLALQCFSFLTVTLFLLVTWKTLPVHADHVPSIVSAYRTVMIMACISIVATVMIINFTRYPPVKNLPSLVTMVLTYEWTSTLFFLPASGDQVNKNYSTLGETEPINECCGKKDDLDLLWNWILLSTVIDRTMFFIYSILFFYIFSAFR